MLERVGHSTTRKGERNGSGHRDTRAEHLIRGAHATRWRALVVAQNMSDPKYAIGERVELHPATDAWMQGLRFGTVLRVGVGRGRQYVYTVACDRLGQTFNRRVSERNILGAVK